MLSINQGVKKFLYFLYFLYIPIFWTCSYIFLYFGQKFLYFLYFQHCNVVRAKMTVFRVNVVRAKMRVFRVFTYFCSFCIRVNVLSNIVLLKKFYKVKIKSKNGYGSFDSNYHLCYFSNISAYIKHWMINAIQAALLSLFIFSPFFKPLLRSGISIFLFLGPKRLLTFSNFC